MAESPPAQPVCALEERFGGGWQGPGVRKTWGTHTKATPTYLMVFLLPEPRELTRLLGFPGVHLPLSVPIHESKEVSGQLGDAMKRSPCATCPAWGTASVCAPGRCDSAGAGCVLQVPGESAGDKRPKASFSADALLCYHRDGKHGCTQRSEDRASLGCQGTNPSHAGTTITQRQGEALRAQTSPDLSPRLRVVLVTFSSRPDPRSFA